MWTPAHFYAELHRIAWNCANFDTIITEWGVPAGAGGRRGVPGSAGEKSGPVLGELPLIFPPFSGVPGSAGECRGNRNGSTGQGKPGGARESQEEPGRARRSQEEPRGAPSGPKEPLGAPRIPYESLGAP